MITSCTPATALDQSTEDPEMNQLSLPSRNSQSSQLVLSITGDKINSTSNSLKEEKLENYTYLNIYKIFKHFKYL